jgi:hypothetical protein
VERMQDHNESLAALKIFIFSPFGLCCCHEDCPKKPGIKIEHRSIQMHLRKHGFQCNASLVKDIVLYYKKSINQVRESGHLDSFIVDKGNYTGYACECGIVMTTLKAALCHCNRQHCNPNLISRTS